ncbi:hypothetical protein SAMN02990966_06400 [Rhodospirillales bacterium URHD0017]|nr:hypothetical protein SAMN02990966_06400 [Rhodospirillales bacterium URHD0017]
MEGLPHLVVAHLQQQAGEDGFERANIRCVQMMLKRLFAKLQLNGPYAIRIERRRGVTELMCAFAEERDAENAARTVGAATTGPYPGWQTQRAFVMDGQKQDELSALAGKYRQRRRQASRF